MKHLIEVNSGYFMMIADRFKSFFALQVEDGWQVVSVNQHTD